MGISRWLISLSVPLVDHCSVFPGQHRRAALFCTFSNQISLAIVILPFFSLTFCTS